MKPVNDKNFLKFLGKSLIEWQLDMLSKAGFEDIILVGGSHNIDMFRLLSKNFPTKITVVEQKNLDEGMMGAVLSSTNLFDNKPLLVFSSNDVVDQDAFDLVMKSAEKSPETDCFMLAKKVREYFPGGYIAVDDSGFVKNIVEKPEPGTEPSDLVNLVVHYFRDTERLINSLKTVKSEKDDLYEVAIDKLISEGFKIRPVVYDGYWQAIKYPWHARDIFKHFFDISGKPKISKSAQVSDKAFIDGPVFIDDDAKIMAGASVKGPCYIGKGTIIATNSLVRDSNIGANCVIGFSTEIARSHIGDNVWTHSNYIGDSVIGNDVSFGAGTVVGNLRLDEGVISTDSNSSSSKVSTGTNKWGLITGDHIRVGVNTSFMPGVKIGGESYIGAGIVVSQDIPEKSFVRGEFKIKISKNDRGFSDASRSVMKKKL